MNKRALIKLKQEATIAIEKKDFKKGFESLWILGVDAFILYFQKKKWTLDRNHKDSATYYWNTFIVEELYFDALMTSPLTEVLLHDYYSKTNIFS